MTDTSLDQWLNEKTAEAHNNSGAWFEQQGRLEDAAACYFQALALKPDFAAAHNNLGIVRERQDRLDDAVACV